MPQPHSTRAPARRTPWQIQRAVVFALFLRELKTRFGGRWMGVLWLVGEPLAQVLLLTALYGAIRNALASTLDYPVFLVTGMIPYLALRNLALRMMEALDANAGLFGYRQVKPMDALLARALLEAALYAVVYLCALALLGRLGHHWLPVRPLEQLVVFALFVLLGVAFGALFAVATDEFPKARAFVRLASLPLYLVSGVLFPLQHVPADALAWLRWNPVLHLVELSRWSFLPQYRLVDGVSLAYPAALTLLAGAFALALYRVRRLRLVAQG